jgi:ATP-dependent helicase HrpB
VTPLPIDLLLPQIIAELKKRNTLVIEAPPGAGKTTRVPRALLDAGMLQHGDAIVLQPRRLAARLAARRVADELDEPLGQTVGYQIRFEEVASSKTKIRFLTEGLLLRKLVERPDLPGVDIVILDEFHERHLASDLSLALLRRLQRQRPSLKLLVMSATLDAAPIAQWLDNATVMRSEGRLFPVNRQYLETEDKRAIEVQVEAALKRALANGLQGHVLVFLPGAGEIRRCVEQCQDLAQRHHLRLCQLHGEFSSAEQDAALQPSTQRKVIFSTNVAETSVTIEGVTVVIDTGLARVATHSPWSGHAELKLSKVSKSSVIQRAGRAGRTQSGTCLHLYPKYDFESRPQNEVPEIRRADLTESLLLLKSVSADALTGLSFFEAPPAAPVAAAESVLQALGALLPSGALSDVGKRMLQLPLHPRLARLFIESERRNIASLGATACALLAERDLRLETRAKSQGGGRAAIAQSAGRSDVVDLVDRYALAEQHGAGRANVDSRALTTVRQVRSQLLRLTSSKQIPPADAESQLLQCVLQAFPDRVMKRRQRSSPQVVFAGGGSAVIAPHSVCVDTPLMVAIDTDERSGQSVVQQASAIENDWLLFLEPSLLSDTQSLEWNSTSERVDFCRKSNWGNVVLDEYRQPADTSAAAAALLKAAALQAGVDRFVDKEKRASLESRLKTLAQAYPSQHVPQFDTEGFSALLDAACASCRSFRELEAVDLLALYESTLPAAIGQQLKRELPDKLTLPGGRTVTVHYSAEKPPWIESRLQDFFGLSQGPRVGKIPIVIHLLAPNTRAVQVTSDLAGFWQRHYPAIRKELMRRYPRHSWPEDPLTASPPAPRHR